MFSYLEYFTAAASAAGSEALFIAEKEAFLFVVLLTIFN